MFISTNNIDTIYRKDKKYYPKVLLEKYYFVVTLKKNIIIKNL